MPKVFRQNPPSSLVDQVLQTFGLQSIHDTSWFSKKQIQLQNLENILPELEPYYIPCKAQEYLYTSITHNRALTILRQILRVHQRIIVSKEKTCGNEKQIWYQLQKAVLTADDHILPGEICVSFT